MNAQLAHDIALALEAVDNGRARAFVRKPGGCWSRINDRRAELIQKSVCTPGDMTDMENAVYTVLQHVSRALIGQAFPVPEPTKERIERWKRMKENGFDVSGTDLEGG